MDAMLLEGDDLPVRAIVLLTLDQPNIRWLAVQQCDEGHVVGL